MRERGLELADRFHALRIGDQNVVGIERKGEEAPLIGIADDEKLFGTRLAEERRDVRTHPADLGSHRLEKWKREQAVPLVRILVLEVDEVEHVYGRGQVGAVQSLDGVAIELVPHAHSAVLAREAWARHRVDSWGVPWVLVAPIEVR